MKNWQDLPIDQANMIVPPNFVGFMCGASFASQDRNGTITVTYTDGTTESAPCGDVQIQDVPTFFGIVSMVQDRARK